MNSTTTELSPTELSLREMPGAAKQYNTYAVDEDTVRSSFHYERDPEIFYILTGGEWNTYACCMWEDGFTMTQAQEKKFNHLARLMDLKPGMKMLDIGFGWGGPLVYYCKHFGVVGHGIAVSQSQVDEARKRAAQHGVPATFELVHWQRISEDEKFDIIYTDEVITHFTDLHGFFAKCRRLLKPGGVMMHKELHLSQSRYAEVGPAAAQVFKVYAYTGNYRPLHYELKALDDNNFELLHIEEVPMWNYLKTTDAWNKQFFDNRERLKAIGGDEFYHNFRSYLKSVRHIFGHTNIMQLHIVLSRKMD